MITTDVKELQQLCREWQERLNLTNWRVSVRIRGSLSIQLVQPKSIISSSTR